MKKIDVIIPHAAWAEGRKESLSRLVEQLERQDMRPLIVASTEREHAQVWAPRAWRAAVERDADATIFLNDDVDVAPDLLAVVRVMAELLPDEIISLHSQLPVTKALAEAGQRWVRCYWASGPGYCIPRAMTAKILEWMVGLPKSFLDLYNEDGYLSMYAYGMRRPIWHCIPALVQHRVEVASTLGYDDHPLRVAVVDWKSHPLAKEASDALDLSARAFWLPTSPPTWVENPWLTTVRLQQLEAGPEPTKPTGARTLLLDEKTEELYRQGAEMARQAGQKLAHELLDTMRTAGPNTVTAMSVPDTEPAPAAIATVALAIPHAAWKKERRASYKRLCDALHMTDTMAPPWVIAYDAITERARNEVWSLHMWEWFVESGADWCLQLQDDAIPAPNFWACLRAMLESFPLPKPDGTSLTPDVVCLESAHPAAPALAEDDVRWYSTAEGLVGVGYLIRRSVLVEFLEWRRTQLRAGWDTAGRGGSTILTEDTLLGIFCMCTGRRIFCPVPTIIDHDTEIASVYGNDAHVNRRPLVRWDAIPEPLRLEWRPEDLEAPGFWQGRFKRIDLLAPDGTLIERSRRAYSQAPEPPRDFGRLHDVTPTLARNWVQGFGDRELAMTRADNGMRTLRKMAYARKARFEQEPKHKILVCTPTRGGISPRYHEGLAALVHLVGVDVTGALELLDTWEWDEDVCRTRARMVAAFLETDANLLHFRDSDIGAGVDAVAGMLRAIDHGHEFVVCPYPRRDAIDFDRALAMTKKAPGLPLEAFAYQYPVGLPIDATDVPLDAVQCTPLDWAPLGCSLITRGVLEKMVAHYRDEPLPIEALKALADGFPEAGSQSPPMMLAARAYELGRSHGQRLLYVDRNRGDEREVVGLFQLMIRALHGDGPLRNWGEDQAFCFRWTDIGGNIAMYLGPGSPVDHDGTHLFKGHVEAFGKSRTSPEAREAIEKARGE